MSENTITPTLNQVADNSATTVTLESPSVLAPQISERDAFAMPMADLKQAAGIEPASQQPQATPTTQGQPTQAEPYTLQQTADGVELHLSTGEVFKGKDINDVLPKLVKSKVDTTVWARQVRKQYDEFQQNPNQPVQMAQEPGTPEMETQAAMEQAKAVREYFKNEILTPELKAAIVAEAVGVPADQLPQVLSNITETSRNFALNNTIMEFRVSNPSFVETPENTQAMLKAMSHLPPNYMPTSQDLQGAWARALYEGWATPATPASAQVKRPPSPPPMPVMSGGNSLGSQDVWAMPLDDLGKMAGLK